MIWKQENSLEKEIKLKKESVLIFISFIIIASIAYYFFNYKPRKELELYGAFTSARIINYSSGSGSSHWVKYSFEVDGVKYIGNRSVSGFSCDEVNNKRRGCVGYTFRVKYSTRNPEVNEIDLGKYNTHKLIKL
nr:hypothetical protein [uncultured Psychroserpens sp.]